MNINSKNRSSVVFIYCLILFVSIRNANVFFISDALYSLVILFRWVWKSISHGQTFSSFFVRSLRPVRAKKKGRKKKEKISLGIYSAHHHHQGWCTGGLMKVTPPTGGQGWCTGGLRPGFSLHSSPS